jgi:hypothetical protein
MQSRGVASASSVLFDLLMQQMSAKALQAVMASPFSAKADLLIARLVVLGTIHQVFRSILFYNRSPFV